MANGKRNGEHEEREETIELVQPSALPFNRAEIDLQIATAKRYPRVITDFKREAMAMATLDQETASSMFYVLSRDGKTIEGPGVRLAEITASAWGNLRAGSRVVEIDDTFVTAEGAAFDLEKNVAYSIQVKRRITTRSGKRYGDDMIGVTANAACAIAFREAVFKVVPRVYVNEIYERAKKVSIGEGVPMKTRIQRLFDWYGKLGAKPEQVLLVIGKKGVDDIEEDDLIKLHGIGTAIKDGETTWEQVLRDVERGGATVRPESLGSVITGAKVEGQNDAPSSYPRATAPATPTPEPTPTEGGDPFTRF